MKYIKLPLAALICTLFTFQIFAQAPNLNNNEFKQLEEELPTPNSYRSASGAPGHEYWQCEADYSMKIELDDDKQKIYGEETITFHNNSPDILTYLWLQLDQNVRAKTSDTHLAKSHRLSEKATISDLNRLVPDFDGGFKIDYVQDVKGKALSHTINKTMMRIDLPSQLAPGESFSFNIKWWYNINDRMAIGGRSGYEYFEKDENYLYTIAQFFPRMCMYNDVYGWQNKQFLGRGEFTLIFGDYEVAITVPSDHKVASTGVLQNESDVLSAKEQERFDQAKKSFKDPVIVVTQDEAEKNEKKKSTKKSTWVFKAENVRDFAFASSRKFIWDAMAVKQSDGSEVLAMSMYPKEGNPLWEQYSTKAVAHTLKWYSEYTFDYPYPVAWSIHAARIGMEYPMICFNFGRPEEDGTYSERTKYGMIGVIIHEVGHNYFPMIVNSDERQWTWMDEGLNSFLQYLAEQQFERNYPSRRGPAHKITNYMGGDKSKISPIMTNSESIFQFGNNAYGKPATALNILRETVMGRELFDYAFKEYSKRWMFKHPTPADFFRTMEDASGVDLDWFWRGWFYTNDHVDQAIASVDWMQIDSQDPVVENKIKKEKRDSRRYISDMRNEDIPKTQNEIDPSLVDFYTNYDPLEPTRLDKKEYQKYLDGLSSEERQVLNSGNNYYQIKIEKKGGLIMPVIFEMQYTDGTTEVIRLPAEIWRYGNESITRIVASNKELDKVVLDPFLELADVDTSNNVFPPEREPSKFELFKQRKRDGRRFQGNGNPMQKANQAKRKSQSN